MRLLSALVLAACAVAALAWLWQLGAGNTASAGEFAVSVRGPGRALIYEGTVQVEEATALSVLLAADQAAGFGVELRGSPGCANGYSTAYVAAVAGHSESGAGGWVYRVVSPRMGPHPPSESAACCVLQPGDRVEWSWSEEGVLGPPCP